MMNKLVNSCDLIVILITLFFPYLKFRRTIATIILCCYCGLLCVHTKMELCTLSLFLSFGYTNLIFDLGKGGSKSVDYLYNLLCNCISNKIVNFKTFPRFYVFHYQS